MNQGITDPLTTSLPLITLFERQVIRRPEATAIESGRLTLDYASLNTRAWALTHYLQQKGIAPGDRICILSENDPEFMVLSIAGLRLGFTIATVNPRLSDAEIRHCIRLVNPRLVFVSNNQQHHLEKILSNAEDAPTIDTLVFGNDTELNQQLEKTTGKHSDNYPLHDPESIQFIIYTSGTTGLPKAAMISHRAMLARLMVYVLDYGIDEEDTILAWSPLCHMASIELGVGTLLLGGKVAVLDGPDLTVICDYLERDKLSNLIFFPGMLEKTIAYLEQRKPIPKGIKKFGALADLYHPNDIAKLTKLLNTPFTNTFGSTETGMPPLSAGKLAIGKAPENLAKVPSSLCQIKLVHETGRDCVAGETGELAMRGPTLFSGYWSDSDATAEVFKNGWYHCGDIFRLREDGLYDYIDRKRYLIKSGGENIYPAEIERIFHHHPEVTEAVVVKQQDPTWGETPVLIVATEAHTLSTAHLMEMCEAQLPRFKLPKNIFVINNDQLPRSATGKVIRKELEQWVASQNKNPIN